MADASHSDDDAYLRELGIEPKLHRVLGVVTSTLFAVAFQGPTTGALLITGATLAFGGPAFILAIPVIFLFQGVVALLWGELSSHYPLTGGIYQWAKYLGGERLAWFTGLFYLAAIILVMPAVGLVVNIVLNGLFPSIEFNSTNEVIISFIVIVVTAIIIASSVKFVALINSVGVFLELILLGGAAILLLLHAHQPLSILTDTQGTEGSGSYLGPFVLVIALVVTQFVGFETAGTFAEETVNSRLKPAQAIFAGLAGAAFFVFIFDLGLILALPDVGAAMKQPESVIPATLTAVLGDGGAKLFLLGALVAVSSTSIATFAAIVRTMYGMARDGQLPGSAFLVPLSARTNEPLRIIVVVAILSMLPLLAVTQIPVIIAAISALILVPYLLVLLALIRRRMQGWPHTETPFRLGSWGLPLTIIAIVWVAAVLVDALWARPETNPNLGPFPVIWELAVVIVVLGAIWWFAALRGQTRSSSEAAAVAGAGD